MRRGGAGPTKARLGFARGLPALPGELLLPPEEGKSLLGCSEGGAWRAEGRLWAGFRLVARREPNPFDVPSMEGAGSSGGVSASP